MLTKHVNADLQGTENGLNAFHHVHVRWRGFTGQRRITRTVCRDSELSVDVNNKKYPDNATTHESE